MQATNQKGQGRNMESLLENVITNLCDTHEEKIRGVPLISKQVEGPNHFSITLIDSVEHTLPASSGSGSLSREMLLKIVCRDNFQIEMAKPSPRSEEFASAFSKELQRLDPTIFDMSVYQAANAYVHPIPLVQNMRPYSTASAAIESFTIGDILDVSMKKAVDTMVGLGILFPDIGLTKASGTHGGIIWKLNEEAYELTHATISSLLADPEIKMEVSDAHVKYLIQKYLKETDSNAIIERHGALVRIYADSEKGPIFAAIVRHNLLSWKFGHAGQVQLEPGDGM